MVENIVESDAEHYVQFMFFYQSMKLLRSCQKFVIAGHFIKFKNALDTRHHLVGLGPLGWVGIPFVNRLAAQRVVDQIRCFAVGTHKVVNDFLSKCQIILVSGGIVKLHYRFQDRAAWKSGECAGISQPDMIFTQLSDQVVGKFLRCVQNRIVLRNPPGLQQSPQSILATPDVPVPVAVFAQDLLNFFRVGANIIIEFR